MLPHIEIGSLKISTYYSAMVLGYVLMVILMLRKSRREKYNLSWLKGVGFATAGVIVGILGCKILFVLENMALVQRKGFTFGGFSFYGAVFLSPLLMPLAGKLLKLNFRDSLANSAICIIAMLGTIRLGCYLNGCCGGPIVEIKGFYFSFPAQLIECIVDFLILFYLLNCEKKAIDTGFIYPRFLLLYGGARFLIEFIRVSPKEWLYLSHAQWFSIVAVIAGTVAEVWLRKNQAVKD